MCCNFPSIYKSGNAIFNVPEGLCMQIALKTYCHTAKFYLLDTFDTTFFFNSPGLKYVLLVWKKQLWVQNELYLNQEEIFHWWGKGSRFHTWTPATTKTASAGSPVIDTNRSTYQGGTMIFDICTESNPVLLAMPSSKHIEIIFCPFLQLIQKGEHSKSVELLPHFLF